MMIRRTRDTASYGGCLPAILTDNGKAGDVTR